MTKTEVLHPDEARELLLHQLQDPDPQRVIEAALDLAKRALAGDRIAAAAVQAFVAGVADAAAKVHA